MTNNKTSGADTALYDTGTGRTVSGAKITIADAMVCDFATSVDLELNDAWTVSFRLSFSVFGGWDCDAVDNNGVEVDADALAKALGFADDADLFTTMTEGLFVPAFRTAELLLPGVTL